MVMKSTPRVPPAIRRARSSPERRIADRGLDPDGKSRFTGNRLDEVEHLIGVAERAVPGRADAIAIHADPANLGDFPGDLGARRHPANAGFGALTQLELDSPNLRRAR